MQNYLSECNKDKASYLQEASEVNNAEDTYLSVGECCLYSFWVPAVTVTSGGSLGCNCSALEAPCLVSKKKKIKNEKNNKKKPLLKSLNVFSCGSG